MKYIEGSYSSREDLRNIGRLLRLAYARAKNLNAWSVCRFEIWAQRRINDVSEYGETGWCDHFHFWFEESGELSGAIFAYDLHHTRNNPHPYAIILHPDHTILAESMLDWAESQTTPEIEILESNPHLIKLAQKRGYVRSKDSMAVLEKQLSETIPEAVRLPDGFHFKVLEYSDWRAYFQAVYEVFNMMDTESAFRSIQRASSNIPETHLNVLSEEGVIAAFCSTWMDRENNVAEFEPVGTVTRFQKKGLAAALLAQTCNQLREMGCRMVKVEAWSESIGANKLYTASGMVEVDRFYSWKIGE